jgi:cytochrome c-type biogenesis protein CcmE
MGLAVAYLVLMGLQGATVCFLTVSELQAKCPAAQNQLLRVSGNLVPGSRGRDASGVAIFFSIADTAATRAPERHL